MSVGHHEAKRKLALKVGASFCVAKKFLDIFWMVVYNDYNGAERGFI